MRSPQIRRQRAEDIARQAALQAVHDLRLGETLFGSAFDVATSPWAAAQAHNDCQTQGPVGGAVAAALETMPLAASA